MDSGNNSTTETTQVLGSRTRAVVVLPYWSFWESSVPWDLRADRTELLAQAVHLISDVSDVVAAHLIEDGVASPSTPPCDVVVVLATMAAPSATTMAFLDRYQTQPVVVWALSRATTLPQHFSHTDVTTGGSTVGAPMVTSALARAQRSFQVVATALDEPQDALDAVRRAAAAGRVSTMPILRIGIPISGYTTVVPPEGSKTPFRTADVTAEAFAERAIDAEPAVVHRMVEEITEQFHVHADVTSDALGRAAQIEVALRELVTTTGAVAGTLNCHVERIRGNPAIGIAPCLALGRLTSAGVPFTCTGDVLTAVAMAVVKSLGHPTLYHEIEGIDFEANEVILANTGEHDLGLCVGRPPLVPNTWFTNDDIVGPCARFSIPAGPGSLVAYVMAPHPRFVVAQGSFTGRQSPDTGTPNAGFRFTDESAAIAWQRWATAGVTHHSVATNAHVGDDVEAVAAFLDAEFIQVS